MVTRKDWANALCERMRWKPSKENLTALVAWMAAEGGSGDNAPPQAKWNPLNTTLVVPGSWRYNSVGVQNYPDMETGIEATVRTFRSPNQGYRPILRHLRDSDPPRKTLLAVENSNWGTSPLAREIVDDVKRFWSIYADKPIGQ